MYIFLSKIADLFFAERSRWLSWAVVLFASGIGVYFSLSFEPTLWFSLVLVEALVVAIYLSRHSSSMLLFMAGLALVLAGFVYVQIRAYRLNQEYHPLKIEMTYVKAKIVAKDYNYRGKPRLILEDAEDFDGKKIKGKIRVIINGGEVKAEVGQCVEMAASIEPLMQPVIVGGYQFSRKLFFEGISTTGFVQGRAITIECEQERGIFEDINSYITTLRENISLRIGEILPRDEASITAAIVAGERGKISEKLYDNYRDSGLAHFISISGLHMSMIAGFMFFLVRFLIALIPPLAVRFDSKKIAATLAVVVSLFYLLISGAEVPSQRAFIMTLIVLLGVLFSRMAISMKTISWAGLVVLLISPEALIGPSFQMSFAAVIAMIAFYEKYAGALHRFLNRGGVFRLLFLYVGGILAADLVASFATLPFVIYHFNRVAVYTTFGNLLAGPVIGIIIMPFVLVAMLLMPFGLEYYPLKIVGFGVGLVNDITAWVSSLDGATWQVLSHPSWGLALVAYGGLWLCIWQKHWRKWGWIGIIIGMLSICLVSVPDIVVSNDGKLKMLKDNGGKMVILPVRGKAFEKKIWLDKTLSQSMSDDRLKEIVSGKMVDKNWIDLECRESVCRYKGLDLNEIPEGASVWVDDGKIWVETVEEYVGERYWK